MRASFAGLLAAVPELVIPEVRYSRLPAAADAQASRRGWRVEAQAMGDLSGDGRADLAFATERPGQYPRP